MIIRFYLWRLTDARAIVRGLAAAGLWLLLLVGNNTIAKESATTVLVLGDSISAAYGMTLEQGWVQLLQQRLDERGDGFTVVNASISGDTSGGGLTRLPQLLSKHEPDVVIIELGGNDGLRGYPIDTLRDNLRQMTELAQGIEAEVLLLPMEVPPNLGRRYTTLFRDSFTLIANETGAKVGKFLLDGVAIDPSLMQGDGIHPTAQAQPQLLDNVWPYLEPLL